jgi:predicted nicotinamide N-methyase
MGVNLTVGSIAASIFSQPSPSPTLPFSLGPALKHPKFKEEAEWRAILKRKSSERSTKTRKLPSFGSSEPPFWYRVRANRLEVLRVIGSPTTL